MQIQTVADGGRWPEKDWSNLERRERERWAPETDDNGEKVVRKTQRELYEERQARLNARNTSNT